MRQIKNLYLAIGGRGERLKIDLHKAEYSSKCFIKFNDMTLLERIIENIHEFVEKIYIIYCDNDQYNDARAILDVKYHSLKCIYIKNTHDDPYACLPLDGDCIAIMGDTYAPKSTYESLYLSIISKPILTVLKLVQKSSSQGTNYYLCKDETLVDYSNVFIQGYEAFDIGQIIYFPAESVKFARDFSIKKGAFEMLKFYIRKKSVLCKHFKCINMNTIDEYDAILDETNKEVMN